MTTEKATRKAFARLRDGKDLNGLAVEDCGRFAEHVEALAGEAPEEREEALQALRNLDDNLNHLLDAESAENAGGAPCTLEYRPFPTAALPSEVEGYVRAQAAALNVAPAMIAVPALVVLAAAVGNSRRAQIKNTWVEACTIWACIIGRSGTLKSPALDAALAPVYALQTELKEEFDRKRAEYEARTEEEKEHAPPPKRTRLRVGDTTSESVALVHAENERGQLLARDELGGWLGGLNQYKRGGSDVQNWIEMYEGRPVVIDRKSSTPPVLNITRPAVSVVGGIQPGVLRKKLEEEHFASGFAARLMLVQPPEQKRRWSEADVTTETQEAYHRLVRRLYDLDYEKDRPPLPLTTGAKDVFTAFFNSNAELQEKLPGGPLRSLLSKVEAIGARLALSLQAAADPDAGAVGEDAMSRGVQLAEWFRYEAARIYQKYEFEEQEKTRDERLAAGLPETFGWKDVGEAWGVERRASFNVIKRLTKKGLAEDDGHGTYRRTVKDDCTMHFVHFLHFTRGVSAP